MISSLRLCLALGVVLLSTLLPRGAAAFDGTPLGELVKTMSPGQWAQLPTTGLYNALRDNGATGQIIIYSGEAEWYPTTKQIFFIGGDHNGCEKFITYSATTNSWTVQTKPAFLQSCPSQNHSYYYQALDPINGAFYFPGLWYSDIRRYDIATGQWSNFGTPPSASWTNRASFTYEYFPGVGLFMTNVGGVFVRREGSAQWTQVAPLGAYGPDDNLHEFSEYSPVHKTILFGGGDGRRDIYKITWDTANSRAVVTTLNPAPITNLTIHPEGVKVAADPASGNFVFLTNQLRIYDFNPVTDVWTQQSGTAPFPLADDDGDGIREVGNYLPVAVSSYGGVIVWLEAKPNSGSAVMWVYKHASGTPVDTAAPLPPTGLTAQ